MFKRARSLTVIDERDLLFKTMSSISNVSESSQAVLDVYKRKIIKMYFDGCFIETRFDGLLTADNFQIDEAVSPEVTKAL